MTVTRLDPTPASTALNPWGGTLDTSGELCSPFAFVYMNNIVVWIHEVLEYWGFSAVQITLPPHRTSFEKAQTCVLPSSV